MINSMEIITEPFVQACIVNHLKSKGWSSNLQSKELRQTGVDIKVRNDKFSRYWLIETKGDPSEIVKSRGGSRSSNFNSALGQIISRMHTKGKPNYKYRYKYGIGFPSSYKEMALKKLPYDVCNKLNLYIFIVNQTGEVEEYDHKQLKKLQNGQ